MFEPLHSDGGQRCIDDGRVLCLLRNTDVDLNICAGCRWVIQIDDKGFPPMVRCRSNAASAPEPCIWF